MGETEVADWLKAEYFAAPWDGWWVGAAGQTGVMPSNNDLESFWRVRRTP